MDPNDPPAAGTAGSARSRPNPDVASRRRPSRSHGRLLARRHWVAALSWATLPVDRRPDR
jgi:hypothetical protein